ncbi:MAG: type I-A CRISPR-associated protein Cas4/Csa1 [Anaerolineae bacterium]
MYFLSEEEKRLVLRKLLPQAREHQVHPDLRGWNWAQPPLAPVYEATLGLYEIAGQYCSTGRDVYLRHVEGVRRPPNMLMVEGSVLHEALTSIILAAKRAIYNLGTECLAGLKALVRPEPAKLEGEGLTATDKEALKEKLDILWDFEYHRIIARVQDVLTRQPHVGADALAALALPVVVEQKLDGRFLGLSAHLSADAFVFSEPMMLDIKFGERRDFHRLTTTGYALVMESLYEFPVNVGCVVYPTFKAGRLLMERDFHLIDDELRQWFIEARDERMRLVEEEIDPEVAEDCYEACPYRLVCHGG